MQGLNKCN